MRWNTLGWSVLGVAALACSQVTESRFGTEKSAGDGGRGDGSTSGGFGLQDGGPGGCRQCSSDLTQVIDCGGNVTDTCQGTDSCDPTTVVCRNACEVAKDNKLSVGCEYHAVFMNIYGVLDGSSFMELDPEGNACFATIVSNTRSTPVKISVDYGGASLDPGTFAWHPVGSGPSLTYKAYDSSQGIPPGEVAILFLAGNTGTAPRCPKASAVPRNVLLKDTGIGHSFRIATDAPVVATQINPYGGGSSAVTGSSLLLPTSTWGTEYVAVNMWPQDPQLAVAAGAKTYPSLNIVAAEDDTQVELLPTTSIRGGNGLPSGMAKSTYTFTLQHGQHAQISEMIELTGSTVRANKPIGFLGGQACMNVPSGNTACDHGEQMIPPVKSLGSEYVAVMHPQRETETGYYRLVGTVNDTHLTYSVPVGGPSVLQAGQALAFDTATPFVITSQDKDHPFILVSYMQGSGVLDQWGTSNSFGAGDPESVLVVPPKQYMNRYIFFVDPTYPNGYVVITRVKNDKGQFDDVDLDCLGVITSWTPVGAYEFAKVPLITGNFQGSGKCSSGRHEIKSKTPFGLTVWGWGEYDVSGANGASTGWVSYGYPAGMLVKPLNQVSVSTIPQ